MTDDQKGGPIRRLIRLATKVEPNELKATLLSFLFVMLLMTGYSILKPVRDAMSSDWTDAETSWLWTMTFFGSVIAVSAYGAVIPRVRFDRLVPRVYMFFAATFVAFFAGAEMLADTGLLNKVFYVWVSIFSLFHLSVFWSFMSGTYNKEQAPRLFAIIAMGATTGAVIGPAFTALLADDLGTRYLMLIAAVVLLIPVPIIGMLERLKVTDLGNAELSADLSKQVRLGHNPFSGFMLLVKNRYLQGIAVFILLYVMMNTIFYFEMRGLLKPFEVEVRAQIWAGIELAINTLTIVIALFGTARLATRAGMSTTLALVPGLMVAGWAVVAASPILVALIALQVLRRTGNYAITRPAREMLYTLVDQETRYKAKPVVDIVVYRGGDVMTAWAYTAVTAAFGLGLTGIAIMAAGIAAVWAFAGLRLGRTYERALVMQDKPAD